MAIADQARAAYEKKVASLIRRGDKVQLRDLLRIRTSYQRFARRAVAELRTGQGFQLTRGIQQTVLSGLAGEIDRLSGELSSTMRSGFASQAILARELRIAFGESFLPGQLEQVLGISQTARAIDAASAFSADLIGLNQGGLGSRMLAEVNGIVRRAALGIAGETSFDAVSQIQQALRGDPLRRWRFAAERIYRTETLRLHSILTDQTIRDFNTRIPTDKRWAWSGISRPEHRSINGQIAKGKTGRFTVPIKEGGSVRLRFPRDPGGPPSAVINCGCYVVPVPRETRRPTTSTATRRRRPARPKVVKPKTPQQRITAGKRDLVELGVARQVTVQGIHGEAAATALEKVAAEVRRLRKRFPMFKTKPLDRFIIQRPGKGGVYFGHNKTLKISSDYKVSKTFLVNPETGVPFEANFSGTGGIEGLFRHEFGHYIDDLRNINSGPAGKLWDEWRALTRKYPTRAKTSAGKYDRTPGESYPGAAKSWWTQNISSQYSSRWYSGTRHNRGLGWTGDSGVEGGIEAWAELVAWVTKPDYIAGSLPADIEAFVFKILGG